MANKNKKQDLIYLCCIILIIIGLPFGIRAYDRYLEPAALESGTKEFILTGHAQKGWLLGEVKANDILSLWRDEGRASKPVIEVSKGDRVVIKLRSADVTHGFSLKAYGIYVAKAIKPGKTAYVSFKADRTGTFIYRCNVFCGNVHQHMEGKLVVKEETARPNA